MTPHQKLTNCKNCNTILIGNYCHHCRQKADTGRIDKHYLWHELQHGVLHIDKGILYSVRQLFTRPGHAIREYIQGKRVNHFKPVALLFMLAAIYALLNHWFPVPDNETKTEIQTVKVYDNGYKKGEFEELADKKYPFWFFIFQTSFIALGTYIIFKKKGYNYFEHFILNVFVASQVLIIGIISYPLEFFPQYKTIDIIPAIFLGIWTFSQFFEATNFKGYFKSLCAIIIGMFLTVVFGALIAITFIELNSL